MFLRTLHKRKKKPKADNKMGNMCRGTITSNLKGSLEVAALIIYQVFIAS